MPAALRVAPSRWMPVLVAGIVAIAMLAPAPALANGLQLAPAPPSAGDTGGEGISAIEPGTIDRSSMALEVRYGVRATLRYENGSISVTADLDVRNTSGDGIDRLELNLVPARLGDLEIAEVTVDGRAVTPSVDDQTLIVPLGGVLPADQSATVRVTYDAFLRQDGAGSNWLFAKGGGTLQLYRWIPWVSRVRDFDRANFGEPFVTTVSPRVEVVIETDRPMAIATSGRRTAEDGLTQTYVAERVRDFNVVASPFYRTSSGTVDDTRVQVFYREMSPATLMTLAKRAIARMAPLVGEYPYPTFVVVETTVGYGMESPGLIWIPSTTRAANLPYLVSHEIAHQWFYGLVGNDQASEPFADEAAADFLARYTLGIRRASRCPADRLDGTIYGYRAGCYYEVVYIQGGNFLDDLRRRMGDEPFWRAMREYVATNSFELSGTKRLLDALDAATRDDLRPTYEPRFPRYY